MLVTQGVKTMKYEQCDQELVLNDLKVMSKVNRELKVERVPALQLRDYQKCITVLQAGE